MTPGVRISAQTAAWRTIAETAARKAAERAAARPEAPEVISRPVRDVRPARRKPVMCQRIIRHRAVVALKRRRRMEVALRRRSSRGILIETAARHGFSVAEMEGWQNSVGVGVEIEAFGDAKKPIVYLDPAEAWI